jgi:hypothetical protein
MASAFFISYISAQKEKGINISSKYTATKTVKSSMAVKKAPVKNKSK